MQFTIILLVWHLIAVVTIEAAEHCAFSLLTVSSFVGICFRLKKEVRVTNCNRSDETNSRGLLFGRYTYFVLPVSCCRSTLS